MGVPEDRVVLPIAGLIRLFAAAGIVVIAATATAALDAPSPSSEPNRGANFGPHLLTVSVALIGAVVIGSVVIGAVLIGSRMLRDTQHDSALSASIHAPDSRRVALGTGRAAGIGVILVMIAALTLTGFLAALSVQVWVAGVPLGMLLGAEIQACSRRHPMRFVRCVGMVGMVGIVVVVVSRILLDATGNATGVVSDSMLLVVVLLGVALGVRWAARTAATATRAQWDAQRGSDARRRAEWIHDHLLSELSHTILTLKARPNVDHEAVAHLHDVDHRLRMVQLDELMSEGPTRVASILQPHLRWAENHGLRIVRTPSSEDVNARVAPGTGRMLSRVLSVLVSNAANAGAGSVGLEVTVQSHEVTVALHDDAGGFDLAAVPAGRALEELRTDLGDERISQELRNGGSVVTVRVPRDLLLGRSAAMRRSADRTVM